ncbi:MAG: hypothetical protein LBB42_00480 [Coriobacteriales bacterium]|nr:hypothetical protein [Coriobacteriales bacterium]
MDKKKPHKPPKSIVGELFADTEVAAEAAQEATEKEAEAIEAVQQSAAGVAEGAATAARGVERAVTSVAKNDAGISKAIDEQIRTTTARVRETATELFGGRGSKDATKELMGEETTAALQAQAEQAEAAALRGSQALGRNFSEEQKGERASDRRTVVTARADARGDARGDARTDTRVDVRGDARADARAETRAGASARAEANPETSLTAAASITQNTPTPVARAREATPYPQAPAQGRRVTNKRVRVQGRFATHDAAAGDKEIYYTTSEPAYSASNQSYVVPSYHTPEKPDPTRLPQAPPPQASPQAVPPYTPPQVSPQALPAQAPPQVSQPAPDQIQAVPDQNYGNTETEESLPPAGKHSSGPVVGKHASGPLADEFDEPLTATHIKKGKHASKTPVRGRYATHVSEEDEEEYASELTLADTSAGLEAYEESAELAEPTASVEPAEQVAPVAVEQAAVAPTAVELEPAEQAALAAVAPTEQTAAAAPAAAVPTEQAAAAVATAATTDTTAAATASAVPAVAATPAAPVAALAAPAAAAAAAIAAATPAPNMPQAQSNVVPSSELLGSIGNLVENLDSSNEPANNTNDAPPQPAAQPMIQRPAQARKKPALQPPTQPAIQPPVQPPTQPAPPVQLPTKQPGFQTAQSMPQPTPQTPQPTMELAAQTQPTAITKAAPAAPTTQKTPLAKAFTEKLSRTDIDEDSTPDDIILGEEPGEDELSEQKRRRWPLVIAALLSAILVAGVVAYGFLYQKAALIDEQRREGYQILDESIALIQESDAFLVSFNKAIEEQITEDSLSQHKALLEQVVAVQSSLALAGEKAQKAGELFDAEQDKELAQHVFDAAKYRQSTLESGTVLVEADAAALTSLLAFDAAWSNLLEADKAMRKAVTLGESGSRPQVEEAAKTNRKAVKKLTQAQTKLTEAQAAFPQVGYGPHFTYLVLKQEAVELALKVDKALLDNNVGDAKTYNAEFAAKNKELVKAAKKLPQDIIALINAAFEEATAEAYGHYQEMRLSAAEADEFIRAYTGAPTQAPTQAPVQTPEQAPERAA